MMCGVVAEASLLKVYLYRGVWSLKDGRTVDSRVMCDEALFFREKREKQVHEIRATPS